MNAALKDEREEAIRPGAYWRKIRSGRIAQISGMNADHIWLHWVDDGRQTVVKRERFRRTSEWHTALGEADRLVP